jgi:hypothetical protein
VPVAVRLGLKREEPCIDDATNTATKKKTRMMMMMITLMMKN